MTDSNTDEVPGAGGPNHHGRQNGRVGDRAGADAWCWQALLAQGVSVGAPPDQVNPRGQDWGLTPFIPHKLRAAGYQPLIETIRATARHAGGLRIDHVMGLFHLYWIPKEGGGPAHGGFVRTRADELLAITILESARAGATCGWPRSPARRRTRLTCSPYETS